MAAIASGLKWIARRPFFSWREIKPNFLLATLFLMTFFVLFLIYNQFRYFRVTSETIFDSEMSKILSPGWPRYQLIDRINRTLPDDAVVLVFRVADFAYYGKRRYVSYIDDKIADHVLQKNIDDVWHFLRDKGITHIYLPPYPIPSVYNSTLEKLLASPSHSRLLYDFDGYRLFSLRSSIASKEVTPVFLEDFNADPKLLDNWSLKPEQTPSTLNADSLLLPGPRAILSRANKATLAYRGRLKYEFSPLMYNVGYGFKGGRIYQFLAEAEGDGFLEVFLLGYMRKGVEVQQRKIPIWSGVLHGNARQLAGLFTVMLDFSPADSMIQMHSAYRLVFKLNSGKFARILRWEVNETNYGDLMPMQVERQERNLLYSHGWSIEGKGKNRHYLIYGQRNNNGKTVFLKGQDSQTLELQSSPYFVPAGIWRNYDDSRFVISKIPGPLYPIDPQVNQVIDLSFRAKGDGALGVQADITCAQEQLTVKTVNVSRIVLSERMRDIKSSFYSPCRPKNARMILEIQPDEFTVGKRPRQPPEIFLEDLSMKLRYVDLAGNVQTVRMMNVSVPITYTEASRQ